MIFLKNYKENVYSETNVDIIATVTIVLTKLTNKYNMKKILIFASGVITGVVLTVLLLYAVARLQNGAMNGVTYFDNPGDTVDGKSFQVFQVLEKGAALVNGQSDVPDLYPDMSDSFPDMPDMQSSMPNLYLGPIYLITNSDGKYYYDEEIINVPDGKVARQVGIFKYPTKNEFEKTVPIIEIMDR